MTPKTQANVFLDRAINLYEPGDDIFEADNLRLNVVYTDLGIVHRDLIPGLPDLETADVMTSIFFLYTGVTDTFMVVVRSYANDNNVQELYRANMCRNTLVKVLTRLIENDVCVQTC